MAKTSSSAGTYAFFVCVILIVLLLAIIAWRVWRSREVNKPGSSKFIVPNKQAPSTKYKTPAEVDKVTEAVQAMYQPVEFGTRTGKQQVFRTSKGLRSYDVNEMGMPLPTKR